MVPVFGLALLLFSILPEPFFLRLWPKSLARFPARRKTVRTVPAPPRPADASAGYRDPGLADGALIMDLPERVAVGEETLLTVSSGATYLLHPSALVPSWIVRIEVTRDGEEVELSAQSLRSPLLLFIPLAPGAMMLISGPRSVPTIAIAAAVACVGWMRLSPGKRKRRQRATEAALDLCERSLRYSV
jgi:hypothetical protein